MTDEELKLHPAWKNFSDLRDERGLERPKQPGLFIGIDWADQKHDCYIIDRDAVTMKQ